MGPDLSKFEKPKRGMELLQHILDPSQEIADEYKMRTIVTSDGKMQQGFVVSENASSLRVARDPLSSDAAITISKTEIDDVSFADVSPMPTGLLDRSSKQEVLDLLLYLESLSRQRAE